MICPPQRPSAHSHRSYWVSTAACSDAVAQLVITFILNHSCSLTEQQRLIQSGDRTNGFSAPLRTPHFELGGKTLGLVGEALRRCGP